MWKWKKFKCPKLFNDTKFSLCGKAIKEKKGKDL